jgi:hypothetical protein
MNGFLGLGGGYVAAEQLKIADPSFDSNEAYQNVTRVSEASRKTRFGRAPAR